MAEHTGARNTGAQNTAHAARESRRVRALLVPALALALAGCVSLGTELPESLLTLSPTTAAAPGAGASAGGEDTAGVIAVLTPEVPAKLDVLRVPVDVSETQIAYLAETFWIEKPARLFRRLLGESLRAKGASAGGAGAPLVLDSDDTPLRAEVFLRGTLNELGYHAPSASVVVQFDAVRSDAQGNALTRRFEARESGIEAEADAVGPALNRAANTVADEVAAWMLSAD